MKKWFLIILSVILVAVIGGVSYCLWSDADLSERTATSTKEPVAEEESPYQFKIVNVDVDFVYKIAVYTQSGSLKLLYDKPDYIEKIVYTTETDMYYLSSHNKIWRVPIRKDAYVLQWAEQEILFSETVPIERLLDIQDSYCIYVDCNGEIGKKNIHSDKRVGLSAEERKRANQQFASFPQEEYDKRIKTEEVGIKSLELPYDEEHSWEELDEYEEVELESFAEADVLKGKYFANTDYRSDANINSYYTYVADWDGKVTVYNNTGDVVKKSKCKNVYQIFATDKYLYYTSGDSSEPRYEVWRCPLKKGIPQDNKTELVWNLSYHLQWKDEENLAYLFYAAEDYIVCQDEENCLYRYDMATQEVRKLPFSADSYVQPLMDGNNHAVLHGRKVYVSQSHNLYELDMENWKLKCIYRANNMSFKIAQRSGSYLMLASADEYDSCLYLLDMEKSTMYEVSVWKELKNYFKTHKVWKKGKFSEAGVIRFYVYENRLYLLFDIGIAVPEHGDDEEDGYTEDSDVMFFSVSLSDGKGVRIEDGLNKALAKVNKAEYGGTRAVVLLKNEFLLKGDENFYFYNVLTGYLGKKSVESCETNADVQMSGVRPIDPDACHDGDEGEGDE